MDLSGKVALITGASRGIGREIAIEMARAGAAVAINYRQDEGGAIATLSAIKALKRYGMMIKADVADYTAVQEMMDTIVKKLGKIDILVNNAGISKRSLFIDSQPDDWEQLLAVNLKGTMNCCHTALKYMLPRRSGCIINITSIWGNVGSACETVYSASKGGINAFTKALAKEVGSCGIRVNAIAPGAIDTGMNDWMSPADRQTTIDNIPLGRLGRCNDVAALAVFLASDLADYINGQVITVDGAMT